MKVRDIPLDQIRPYWRNPRNNADAVEAVKASIQRYGMNQPLVLDTENTIIAGHTRYKALVELGEKKAPCIVVDLPEAAAKEYRIADNKASELASWDMDKLVQELRELPDLDTMEVFFGADQIEDLLRRTAGAGDFGTPSQEQIDRASEQIATRFDGVNQAVAQGEVELTCPHCGGKLYVQRSDVQFQPT